MRAEAHINFSMTRRQPQSAPAKPSAKRPPSSRSSAPPTVSPWGLAGILAAVLAGAVVCAWLALCFMFWQGNWQLLYHPTAALNRTPANVGVSFESVAFATTEAGTSRLKGWWIPAAPGARDSRFTALYLHGANGNLGDSVDALAELHAAGVNILAFDYRGYGQSQFVHPSEAHWRQDADWALLYLTATRNISASSIVLVGNGLGASLALEVAAAHPDLAGVVLQQPDESPVDAIFRDPRARLVPAHLLVRDRYDLDPAASSLRIPSLWFYWTVTPSQEETSDAPEIFERVAAPKSLVWLPSAGDRQKQFSDALSRWLDSLSAKARNP